MEKMDSPYRMLAAAGVGLVGGLLLGRYLWRTQQGDKSLSEHLATLSKLVEQIEGLSVEDEDLKGRIENILETIESTYGNSEE